MTKSPVCERGTFHLKMDDKEKEKTKARERFRELMKQASEGERYEKQSPKKNTIPFFRVPRKIITNHFTGLNPTQRLIAICIFAHYNPEKGYSYPSWKNIQAFVGVGKKAIARNLPVVLKHCNIRKQRFFNKNTRYFVS
jgi:hypothetical protein